jgi:hypothetical protein
MCFSKSKTVNAIYIICCVLLSVSILLLPFNKINYSALICCIAILLIILAIGITNNNKKQNIQCRIPADAEPLAPAEQDAVPQKQAAPVRMSMPNQRCDMGSMMPRDMGSMMPRDMGSMMPRYMGSMMPRDMGSMMPRDMGSMMPRDMGSMMPQCELTPPPAIANVPGNIMLPVLRDQHVSRGTPQQMPLLIPVQMESAPLFSAACAPQAEDGAKRDKDDVAQCGPGFTVIPPMPPRVPPTGPQIVPNLPPFPGVAQYTGESMWRLPEWPVNQPSREESIAAVVPDLPTCSSNQASKNAIRNQGLYGIKGNVSCDLLKRSAVADAGFLQPLGARNAFLAYNTYDQLHSKDQYMIPENKQQF